MELRLRLKLTQVTSEAREERFRMSRTSLIISPLNCRAPSFRNTDGEFTLVFLYRKTFVQIVSALRDLEP